MNEIPKIDTASARPANMDSAEWETRVDLAACYRLVDLYGMTDLIYTHISARVPGPEQHFLINAYGLLFEEMTASRLVKIAPGVTVDFHPSGTLDLPDLLDRAEIDLAVGPFTEQGERFSRQLLLQDEFVAVLRKNHPMTSARALSIERFAALPQFEISSVRDAPDFVDQALRRAN